MNSLQRDEVLLAANEIQLLLSEKRTALSLLRTGIAVFALPLSVMGLLVATSRNYQLADVIHIMTPLLALCAGLVALASYLVLRAVLQVHRCDAVVRQLKERNRAIAALID